MDQVMVHAASVLTSGISEVELMAELEHQARRLGHLGIVRMRNWNGELFFQRGKNGRRVQKDFLADFYHGKIPSRLTVTECPVAWPPIGE